MSPRRLFSVFLLCSTCNAIAVPLPDVNAAEPTPDRLADSGAPILAPGDYTFEVPGWTNRACDLHVPVGYRGEALPLIVGLHGGAGSKESFARQTCRHGDLTSPTCLSALADRERFFVVYPNGFDNPDLPGVRTWNAGGGENGFTCISGLACTEGSDDVGYVRALLDAVAARVNVDPDRVFATGMSNGGAMSHRLACELSDRIAAIAPVAGANQIEFSHACAPSRPVPVLEIHGTSDACWPYLGAQRIGVNCAGLPAPPGAWAGVPATVSEWAARNGCAPTPSISRVPNRVLDGTDTTQHAYLGCRGRGHVIHYKVNRGGHTWPDGWSAFPRSVTGVVPRDFNANEVIWRFFRNHPMPPRTAPKRVWSSSFESAADFAGFYVTPPDTTGTAHQLSTGQVRTGQFAHEAWIYTANPPSTLFVNNNHRGYPTIQLHKLPGGGFTTPVEVELWVWLDMKFAPGEWFSLATLSTDASDDWTRVVQANVSDRGMTHLMHVPGQRQGHWTSQRTDVPYPMRQWARVRIRIDFDPDYGSAAVWLNGDLVSTAPVRGGTGRLEQAHFGMYAPPSLGAGVVFNDDLVIREVD